LIGKQVNPPFDKLENEVLLGGKVFLEHLATDWLHLWNEGLVAWVLGGGFLRVLVSLGALEIE
jgi:hypothetical protein